MHEYVRDLPEDYDTALGNEGAALSGGQRQHLAIARALLSNQSVLILGTSLQHIFFLLFISDDEKKRKKEKKGEATSALDVTSHILVFEALKRWRKRRTTVVITHDLSQITPEDFVYVLKSGEIVEQGYRADL
jgi:ATP-binding cassette, subfamily B (MDR/TAP), member 1